MYQNNLEGLLKHRLLGLPPQVSEPAGLSWSLNIFLSNKSSGAASAAGPHLENHCINQYQSSEKKMPQTVGLKPGSLNQLLVKGMGDPVWYEFQEPPFLLRAGSASHDPQLNLFSNEN